MSNGKQTAAGRHGNSAGHSWNKHGSKGKGTEHQTAKYQKRRAGKSLSGKAVPKQGKANPFDALLTRAAKQFVRAGGTKLMLKVFPYLLFGYFGDKLAYAYRMTAAPDFFNKLVGSLANLGAAFGTILPSFHPKDLLFGAVFGAGMRFAVYFKGKNAKKFRKGEEYGSARWGAYYQL